MGSMSVSNSEIPSVGPVRLITDSSSQLTSELAQEHQVEVVPVTISLDGVDYLEGVDLDADLFYSLYSEGSELSTAQPAPGLFVEAVERSAALGAEAVIGVFVGSAYSGTVQSAKVAASQTSIPFHVVDTGSASFGVSCCLLAASKVLSSGGSIPEAIQAAMLMATTVETVFVLQGLELARGSGRFHQIGLTGSSTEVDDPVDQPPTDSDGIMVLWSGEGELEVVGTAYSFEEAASSMAERALRSQKPIWVASSLAGPEMEPMSRHLDSLLEADPLVVDIIHYRVGPSVAAQTGPGTAGIYYYPA